MDSRQIPLCRHFSHRTGDHLSLSMKQHDLYVQSHWSRARTSRPCQANVQMDSFAPAMGPASLVLPLIGLALLGSECRAVAITRYGSAHLQHQRHGAVLQMLGAGTLRDRGDLHSTVVSHTRVTVELERYRAISAHARIVTTVARAARRGISRVVSPPKQTFKSPVRHAPPLGELSDSRGSAAAYRLHASRWRAC